MSEAEQVNDYLLIVSLKKARAVWGIPTGLRLVRDENSTVAKTTGRINISVDATARQVMAFPKK